MTNRFKRIYVLLLLCICMLSGLLAQAGADSLVVSLNLLGKLVEDGNYEEAQLEAGNFRALLQRQHRNCPPAAIALLSGIYQHNRDASSALLFLDEAGRSVRNNPDPELQEALFSALEQAYTIWEKPELAQSCQQLMEAARDSVREQSRRSEIQGLRRQMDSLAQARQLDVADQARYVRLERSHAALLAGATVLFFLILLFARARAEKVWRKRLAKKELEMEFLRSDRYAETLAGDLPAAHIAAPETSADERAPYRYSSGKRPDKTALLIEPNRQIVLYLKSLLADRFEVETAHTANEGLQMATNILPDLIVCDAVLNGKTGIEVARQIKLSERTNHIPVILLTDRYGNEGKLDALRAGADIWFGRPVLDDEFDAQVLRLLEAGKENHEKFARFLQLYFSENRIPLDNPFLHRIIQFIEENLADRDFMADDLARKMQMPKSHFVKKLNVLTGKEPTQLIREMRLEKAKVLLEKRAGTPQAVSELVGFSSAGTFALAFKDYFGENTLLLLNDVRRGGGGGH